LSLPFPSSVLSQHVIALGKTRSGKSSKLKLIVEYLLERDEPGCIIDPKGDWWGLKSSANGKSAGYPVVIFGGEHADVPLNPRAGAAVAELIATGNRPSLIDLGGWMVSERTQFFIDFASTWFKVARGHRKLIIDEVHNFAPKGKIIDPQAGKMLHWANRLASEGAGKGTILIAASQRPQKVHNDFLTSCETLIACKVIHKADRDAIKDWIDGCADPAAGRQVITELASMGKPEAWVWSPEADFGPKRISFPMFSTYDSFKPQDASSTKLKGWAEVDLEEVRAKLQVVVAEAEANDPKLLRARIAELERQISGGKRELAIDVKALERAEQEGFERALAIAHDAQRTLLSSLRFDIEGELQVFGNAIGKLLESKKPIEPKAAVSSTERRVHGISPTLARHISRKDPGNIPVKARLQPGDAAADIGAGGKHRMMVALAQQQRPTSQRRLGLLTGLSPRSGTWSTYLSELRKAGYIEGREELSITAAGMAALGAFQPLPTGSALIEYWRQKLGDSGKRTIFNIVVEAFPEAIDQESIAGAANLSARSGTWSTYLSELRGLGLIEGRRELRASEELFR
jgi:uncharacterized protein